MFYLDDIFNLDILRFHLHSDKMWSLNNCYTYSFELDMSGYRPYTEYIIKVKRNKLTLTNLIVDADTGNLCPCNFTLKLPKDYDSDFPVTIRMINGKLRISCNQKH